MYTVVRMQEYMATRDVWLKNEETGTIDICFDDSLAISEAGFDFLKVGEQYECKIGLFGEAETGPVNGAVPLKIVSKRVKVGNRNKVKVNLNGDIYYITPNKIPEFLPDQILWFSITRKDLIQVDDVLNSDYELFLGSTQISHT